MQQRHLINAGIVWFVLTFIGELILQLPGLFPPPVAYSAEIVDDTFHLLAVLGMPVFTMVIAFLGYSMFMFRVQDDSTEDGATVHGNNIFSVGWLIVTGALCIFVIIHPGLTGLAALAAEPNDSDLVVQVTGSQWAWRITYPQYDNKSVFRPANASTAVDMVLPVGRRTRFELSSRDVLHSFWIPAFRLKKDIVPGQTQTMYVTPTETGSYDSNPRLRVQCAELCGLNHTDMMLPVRVVSQDEFEVWAGGVKPTPAPTEETAAQETEAAEATPTHEEEEKQAAIRGEALALDEGCADCHSVDGSIITGPSWLGVYGEEVTLEDGSTVKVDEDYLRESIMDPNAKIVKDFPGDTMPQTFGENLTEDQINDLIAYIESLSED